MSDKPQQSSSGQSQPQARADEPYIPASQSLPEITLKAILLAIVLAMVLAGANAYLGLKAGMTVSASIPAAVISMALLRLFKNSNILENNIVQTAASAGESLAAGVIFTLPALVLLGAWEDFDFWETTMIAGLGGLLGVTFTIPLRRALIVESPLKFPEGVATAEVLKVGDKGGVGMGEARLQRAARCQGARVAARRETFHQRLIGLQHRHHVAEPDILGRPRQHRAAAAAAPGFQQAGGGQRRDYLGQVVARDPEFSGQIGGGKGAVRGARHAHQHAQPVIGEGGEAHGRDPDLAFTMRI